MGNRIKRGYSFLAMLLFVVVVLLGGYLVLTNTGNNQKPKQNIPVQTSTPTPGDDTRIYESEIFDFQISVPKRAEIKEGNSYVEIIYIEGVISFVVNSTNNDSIKQYIDNSPQRSKTLENLNYKIINGYDAASADNVNKERVYYIYKNQKVYIFSTSSPELYDELEEIVQSFEYTGDEK